MEVIKEHAKAMGKITYLVRSHFCECKECKELVKDILEVISDFERVMDNGI